MSVQIESKPVKIESMVKELVKHDLENFKIKYTESLHKRIIKDIELKNKNQLVSYLYSKLLTYGKYNFLEYLRTSYPEIYLNRDNYIDKKNYKNIYKSFNNLFWYNRDNKSKDFDTIIKCIQEIHHYGIDTFFDKSLSPSVNDEKPEPFQKQYNIILENSLSCLLHKKNKIDPKLKDQIFNYMTNQFDFTNIIYRGEDCNLVKHFISELYLDNSNTKKNTNNDDLLFFLHRYPLDATKILFLSIIENFGGLSDIRNKNNTDIDWVVKNICQENLVEVGFKKYFENINMNQFKSSILFTILNNYKSWIKDWIDSVLTKENINYSQNYNMLIQKAYRCLCCILGNFYYYGREFIEKKLFFEKIMDLINDRIIFIEHSILYFLENSGIDFNKPHKIEADFIIYYLNIYFKNNNNPITKLYIMDTMKKIDLIVK